jgi:Fic family protein
MWDRLEILRDEYLNQGIMNSIDYEKFCMISIVYNSSKIEGCSLSELDTKILIENNITAQGKPLTDHLMVKDHYHAFLKIREFADTKRPFTFDFIKDVNAFVMSSTGGVVNSIAGSFDTSKGDIRLAQVYVDKKYFPDFSKVPDLFMQFVENTN